MSDLKKIKSISEHRGGGLILSMDYSTLEVRIFASICKDEKLKEVLNSGQDLHCQTARAIFPELKGLSDKEIKEHHNGLRSKAKGCIFGLLYGKSVYNFSRDWNCTIEEAQDVIDGLMGAYPGIQEYVKKQHEFAIKNGYVENVFGVKRPLPGAQLPSMGPTKRQFCHAMNAAQNCFVGDTKIELLDGTSMAFKDVVDAYKKKDLYVYSVEKNGHIIPGKIIAAAQTKIVNELAKVTLDNGEIIKCTTDHKFIMRNGERKEARLLKPGDLMMPLYKHINSKGYVVYKDNLDNKQKQVYDMVYEYYNGKKLSNNSIHHINKNKIDNTPSNLLQVTFSEYCRIHEKEDMSICSTEQVEWNNDHKAVSVEIITCEPTPVYNIEIENREGTHNYALSSGIFVKNSPIQSSASVAAWISGTHVQEEFLLQNMKSIMIGGVHDSTYVDVYPGELIKAMKVFNFHEQIIPNKIHEWLNGVNLMADFGLGQSWGRELDVKSWELKDGHCILTIKGGNVNWQYLKRELDEAYDYEILSIKDGDDIPPEEREDLPIDLSDKYQTITLSFIDDCPNMEFKSKYYVGNGYFGPRIDTRENPIK